MIDPSLTQTIRLYCDGELPPTEAQQFERKLESDAQLRQAVTFERTLRVRLTTVLSATTTKAPPSLVERVHQALAREIDPQPIPLRANGEAHRGASTALPQPTWRINYLALAAVLVLVVGAVMFGIYFPQIDNIQNTDTSQAGILSTLGTYAAEEHDRSASGAKELDLRDPVEMSSKLSEHLKSRVTPIDLSQLGYTFVGAAKCGALPCGGPSGQMLFKRVNKDGSITGPNISLFFVPEGHLADALELKWQRQWVKNNEKDAGCGHRVLRLDYPDTGLVYFLVTCDPGALEPASELVLNQLRDASR